MESDNRRGDGSSILGIWESLIAVCNRCGHKWPVFKVLNHDSTLGLCVELPCQNCGYIVNAVVACDDEEVTPLGKVGALEEFEAKNPGPVNLTEKALEALEHCGISSIIAAVRQSREGGLAL